MVFATAGLAGLGTWSIVEGDPEVVDEVVANCRGEPKLQEVTDSVANGGVGPGRGRGRADRMARIHGLCIQNAGGNRARGDSSSALRLSTGDSRQNLCNHSECGSGCKAESQAAKCGTAFYWSMPKGVSNEPLTVSVLVNFESQSTPPCGISIRSWNLQLTNKAPFFSQHSRQRGMEYTLSKYRRTHQAIGLQGSG
jgi:hypothetical protein